MSEVTAKDVEERWAYLDEWADGLQERATNLRLEMAEREARVAEREEEARKVESCACARLAAHVAVERRTDWVEGRERMLEERERAVEEREMKLAEREAALAAKEAEEKKKAKGKLIGSFKGLTDGL